MSVISSITWVKRGVAAAVPDKVSFFWSTRVAEFYHFQREK